MRVKSIILQNARQFILCLGFFSVTLLYERKKLQAVVKESIMDEIMIIINNNLTVV